MYKVKQKNGSQFQNFFRKETWGYQKTLLEFVCSKLFGFKGRLAQFFFVTSYFVKVQKFSLVFAISGKIYESAFAIFFGSLVFCYAKDSPCYILGMHPVLYKWVRKNVVCRERSVLSKNIQKTKY